MYVSSRENIEKSINDVIDHLYAIVDNKKIFLKQDKSNLKLKTLLQVCCDQSFDDQLKSTIHKIIINHALKAESIVSGGFSQTLKNLSSNTKNFSSSDVILSQHPKINDVISVIKSHTDDPVMESILFESLNLAGFNGKITVEKSNNLKTSVELIDGHNFIHKPIGLTPCRLLNPRIIFIDGYIESVSEINRLLENAAQSKHQLVLVSRGMHDDVLNTTKVNRDRATMFVYPVIINYDLFGINTIVDMCVVSNTTPVSCDKGDLISTISIDRSVIVDEVKIVNDTIFIKNSNSKLNVKNHISSLVQRREERHSDIEDLFNKRIKSLYSQNVVIRLPDDLNYIPSSQTIDSCLRSIKSIIDHGCDNEESSLLNEVSNFFCKKIIHNLKNIEYSLFNII